MEENMKENVNINENQEDVNVKNEVHEEEPKGRRNKRNKNDKQVEELKEKYDELNDKYLRLFSEFDNYRKRTAKEKIELSKTSTPSTERSAAASTACWTRVFSSWIAAFFCAFSSSSAMMAAL